MPTPPCTKTSAAHGRPLIADDVSRRQYRLDRRDLLKWGALATVAGGIGLEATAGCSPPTPPSPPNGKADYTLRIGTGPVELAPGRIVSTPPTTASSPARCCDSQKAREPGWTSTTTPTLPSSCTGMASTWAPMSTAPPKRARPTSPRTACGASRFVPGPAGFRFYHTHVVATGRPVARPIQRAGRPGLHRTQTEPRRLRPRNLFDAQGVRADVHPRRRHGQRLPGRRAGPRPESKRRVVDGRLAGRGDPHGNEVSYGAFAVNGRMLGHGEPIRVRTGQRVLLHVLNGSATETRSLALPGHTFDRDRAGRQPGTYARRRSRCCGSVPRNAFQRSSR